MSISQLGIGTGSNALFINNSNAYVGVGKSNPAYALDVIGSINCTGSVLVNGAALSVGGGSSNATGADNYKYVNYTAQTSYTMPGSKADVTIDVLNMTITPTSATAEIELSYVIYHECANNTMFQLYRNGVKIGTPGTNAWQGTAATPYDADNASTINQVIIRYVDSPATTSAVTYSVAAHTDDGSAPGATTLYINRTTNGSAADGYENCISTAFARQLGGAITVSQSFLTAGSNIYLPAGSNLAIGKSNAAYALDVVGSINCTGSVLVNGSALSVSGIQGPAFRVTMSNSSINLNATNMVIPFNTKVYDTTSAFNTSTYKFQPTTPGYYIFTGWVEFSMSSGVAGAIIYKNGARTGNSGAPTVTSGGTYGVTISDTLYLNGTTDYVQMYAFCNGNGTFYGGSDGSIVFCGTYIGSGSSGGSSQFTTAGSNIYLPAGSNLAIGKSNAIAALDVLGNINLSGNLMINGSNLVAQSAYQISYVFQASNNTTGPAFVGATGTTAILKYTDTYNNSSNALNTSTATFTAPVSGIYMVSAYNIENQSTSVPATLYVSVNGSTTDTTYAINIENDTEGNASTASYPISLSTGNTVQFYVSSGAIYGSTGAGGIASKGRYSIALMNQNTSCSLGQATGMGVPNQVVLTTGSNATWTVPSGVTAVQVEMVGGGGGGAGGIGTVTYVSGGGAAGSYVKATINVSNISSLTYTVGGSAAGGAGGADGTAGNSTILTATNTALVNITAAGGESGKAAPSMFTGRGGLGQTSTISGSAINSSLSVVGGDGFSGAGGYNINDESAGNGGASFFGGGGRGGLDGYGVPSQAGCNGNAYGSGGGGGRGGYIGGNGAQGLIIITYFTQSGLPTNYTATAPLSMTGSTLSIANATSSAPGVVLSGGAGYYLASNLSMSSAGAWAGTWTAIDAAPTSILSFSSGVWTINTAGTYNFCLTTYSATAANSGLSIVRNRSGTYASYALGTITNVYTSSTTANIPCLAGDTVFIATGGTFTVTGGSGTYGTYPYNNTVFSVKF